MDAFHTHKRRLVSHAQALVHAHTQDNGQFSRCTLILAFVFDRRAI